MHEQIINLQQIFDNNRNPENAVHMENICAISLRLSA